MRFLKSKSRSEEAIAIVIVMIAILVLAILAGGFAYSMKVETTLALRANNESELEWLGRSGVEYARWILATQRTCPAEQYDALTQIWAGGSGGPCSTNSALGEVKREVHLGAGGEQSNSYFTWKITDHESKFNINVANEAILQQALLLMGVDAGDFPPLVGAILDWIDPDDKTHVDGAENDYYHGLQPPYDAKNGPIDDLSELLMVRGITPEMYWGAVSTNHGGMGAVYQSPSAASGRSSRLGAEGMPAYSVGFVDLFTPISSGKINLNTASAAVLQLIPGVDAQRAEAIVAARSGEDDGSGITGPFRSIDAGYLFNRVPGLGLEVGRQISRFCDVHSTSFDVEIEAHVGSSTRRFIAVLGRSPNPRDVQVLTFCWKFDK